MVFHMFKALMMTFVTDLNHVDCVHGKVVKFGSVSSSLHSTLINTKTAWKDHKNIN